MRKRGAKGVLSLKLQEKAIERKIIGRRKKGEI
jgi:hypothetical protein